MSRKLFLSELIEAGLRDDTMPPWARDWILSARKRLGSATTDSVMDQIERNLIDISDRVAEHRERIAKKESGP